MADACSAKVLIATADRRVISRPRVRQSAAPSRHERPPTQTRPFASVPALVAAVFGPAVGSAAPMSVAVNAADLQLHWQYVRRSRVHGNQRICTCGMLAAPRSSLPRPIGRGNEDLGAASMPQVQMRWLPCTRDLRTYCQCSCKSAAFTATDIGAAEPTAGPKTAATSAGTEANGRVCVGGRS